MPITGELANQNIKDRYFGQNDPVAKKLLRRAETTQPKLDVPEDKTITTLWVGGLDIKIMEADIRAKFSPFGTISSITMLPEKGCCFVTFLLRASAEEAASALVNNIVIKGKALRLAWGRRASSTESKTAGIAPPPGMGAAPRSTSTGLPTPPPPGMTPLASEPEYPSQDPRQLAAKLPLS
jgi:pre-mRNA-splicing factor RBM22/SLT11